MNLTVDYWDNNYKESSISPTTKAHWKEVSAVVSFQKISQRHREHVRRNADDIEGLCVEGMGLNREKVRRVEHRVMAKGAALTLIRFLAGTMMKYFLPRRRCATLLQRSMSYHLRRKR